MSRLNNDQVSTVLWFACGAAIIGGSALNGLGTLASPGSGFITFLAGLGVCLFSSIGMVEATFRSRKGESWRPVMKGAAWGKAFLVMGALTAYALLLSRLGFLLSTALFVGLMLKVVKPQSWPVAVAGGVLGAAGTYAIFELWLKAQLPRGVLGF